MKNFELRRDRFEFFDGFENPLLNLTYELEVPNFKSFCKTHGYGASHFFLYCLFMGLDELDNFKYRIYEGKVIKVDRLISSYTVIDENNLFNYTRFENSNDMKTFIQNSVAARLEAISSTALINTGAELPLREMKNYVFVTSIPWLKFTSIQHPVFKFKSADIPALAWGKFTEVGDKIVMPFSIQAHHGFVDAFHMYDLGEKVKAKINEFLL